MRTLNKVFLAGSVIGFAAGSIVDFCNVTTNPAWTVFMPLGTVFFGLFLVMFMLEKEMAVFDAEESKKFELARAAQSRPAAENKT